MGNIEKIRQLLRVVKPEKMRKGSGHEHLESDAVALAKLSMKEDKKRQVSYPREQFFKFMFLPSKVEVKYQPKKRRHCPP